MRRRSIPLALSVFASLTLSSHASAWLPDGIPVCTAPGPQGPLSGLQVTYDVIIGSYPGLVVGWEDRRSLVSTQSDLYVRPLDTASTPSPDGTPLCVAPGDQTALALAFGWWNSCGPQHGCGLVIGAWEDTRDAGAPDVFANRAFLPWAEGGVPVCRMPGGQQAPTVAMSTGPGGGLEESVILWEDWRSGTGDIYAQRLDVNGERLWDTSGVAICTAAYEQYLPQVVATGDGAVLAAWYDHRGFPSAARLRVTRLERDGSVGAGWPAGGLEVATSGNVQAFRLLPSGHLVWWEIPPGGARLRATRIQADGQFAAAWSDSGVPVTSLVGADPLTDAFAVDDGGLMVAWFEITYSITFTPYYSLRVTRLGPDGTPAAGWGSTGVEVANSIGWMAGGKLAAGGGGGAYVTWAGPDASDGGLFLQRLDGAGAVVPGWPATGAVVCAASGAPADPVIGLAENGVLVSWLDARGDPADVYAQYVTATGVVGPAAVEATPVADALSLSAARPNPARGPVTFTLQLPRGGDASAEVLDVGGRHVRTLARGALAAGPHTLRWDGRDAHGAAAPAGVYVVRVVTAEGEARARVVRLR